MKRWWPLLQGVVATAQLLMVLPVPQALPHQAVVLHQWQMQAVAHTLLLVLLSPPCRDGMASADLCLLEMQQPDL
jgi:hypothetical protein